MINVLLVEDHELYRMGLSMLLSKADDINLLAEAADGLEGIKKARDSGLFDFKVGLHKPMFVRGLSDLCIR